MEESIISLGSLPTKSQTHISGEYRCIILQELLKQSQGGKLKKGTKIAIATQFQVSRRTVYRIWKMASSYISNNSLVHLSPKKIKNVGRKRIGLDVTKIADVPLRRRTNIRSFSKALNMSKSTLHRRVKEGVLRPHTNAIKPHLTVDNKKARVNFCLSMLHSQGPNKNPIFDNMFSYVHIDEKWFYMSREAERYYLLPEEDEPTRTCKSKRFITKIMFLPAVARPRYDPCKNEEFSGKIGIFPFTYQEPARRNSKNRVAGTLETKAILSVTKEVTKSFLIERVLPAIKSKWPCCCYGSKIFIQQDNAKPHINPSDPDFIAAATSDGFDIELCFQPPNSLDLNVLDLGFFRAIQSLQHQEAPSTIDELVAAVNKSFDEISNDSLNDIFLTLQQSMIEVLKHSGDNGYKVPHMGKKALRRQGNLPLQLECDETIVNRYMNTDQSSIEEQTV